MLRRQDVGHRVVVRRIVGVSQNRTLYTDALGELVDLTETDLTIATAKGTVRVPLREVHRAKRVPAARRPPAAEVIALELAANDAWPAPTQARLGQWILRAADNWTGRANSALAVGDPDRPLEAAIDAVEEWYAAHGQRALINAPLPLAAPVNATLDARGWGARPLTLVQTASVAALLGVLPTRHDRPPVELADSPGDDWFAMVAEHKGTLPAAAARILTGPAEVAFAQVRDADGRLLAVGRGAVTGPDRWLGVALLQTAPHARRQGLAQHVLRELVQWGAQHGSNRAYLQVEERNTGAVALYGRVGFTTHHTYLTREAPVR
ncbi:GNAT family N-acetyltransferase [Actinoplanes sp. M2I2]|uniref:GNAT family N-acetyltransferase n=1 Tax=Actinoplanes sp. M2I2 TaxID=1734444 RepID=UPI002021642A|nr:GNAT family N-acetyltransferase [Actinoplanes sp. M2I2]